jgi:hypothetical protein
VVAEPRYRGVGARALPQRLRGRTQGDSSRSALRIKGTVLKFDSLDKAEIEEPFIVIEIALQKHCATAMPKGIAHANLD